MERSVAARWTDPWVGRSPGDRAQGRDDKREPRERTAADGHAVKGKDGGKERGPGFDLKKMALRAKGEDGGAAGGAAAGAMRAPCGKPGCEQMHAHADDDDRAHATPDAKDAKPGAGAAKKNAKPDAVKKDAAEKDATPHEPPRPAAHAPRPDTHGPALVLEPGRPASPIDEIAALLDGAHHGDGKRPSDPVAELIAIVQRLPPTPARAVMTALTAHGGAVARGFERLAAAARDRVLAILLTTIAHDGVGYPAPRASTRAAAGGIEGAIAHLIVEQGGARHPLEAAAGPFTQRAARNLFAAAAPAPAPAVRPHAAHDERAPAAGHQRAIEAHGAAGAIVPPLLTAAFLRGRFDPAVLARAVARPRELAAALHAAAPLVDPIASLPLLARVWSRAEHARAEPPAAARAVVEREPHVPAARAAEAAARAAARAAALLVDQDERARRAHDADLARAAPRPAAPAIAPPPASERLARFFERLLAAPRAATAELALRQISRLLDEIEDELSGVARKEPPTPITVDDGRLHPPAGDRIVRHADGRITARTRTHVFELAGDGAIRVVGPTGGVVFAKP